MIRGVSNVLAQLIVTTIIFSLSMFFAGVAGVLRLLPALVPLTARALWGVLILSCRLYYLLLGPIAQSVERRWRRNILSGLPRLTTTTSLSLGLGLTLFWLLQWEMTAIALIVFILHGLFVGLIWDEIPDGGKLQMGEGITWDN